MCGTVEGTLYLRRRSWLCVFSAASPVAPVSSWHSDDAEMPGARTFRRPRLRMRVRIDDQRLQRNAPELLQEGLFGIFRTERNVCFANPAGAGDAEVDFWSSRSEDSGMRGVRRRVGAEPAYDRLNLFAQCRVRELRLANRKREPLRASESAFIEGIGEVVSHDCCSLPNKKGYQCGSCPKEERRARCARKGN